MYPDNSSLEVGGSRQFAAYVPISPNTVILTVNDIVGGNAAYGTISPRGFYQSPPWYPLTISS